MTLMALLPLLLLLAVAVAVLVADLFIESKDDLGAVAVTALLVAAGIAAALWNNSAVVLPASVRVYLAADTMALFTDVVLFGGAALACCLAVGYLREKRLARGEYYALLLLSTFGAAILSRAVHLISLFIGLEIMSLGIYAIVGFHSRDGHAVEASAKYFLLGAFASAVLLFGCALAYGATGHLDLASIGTAVQSGHADARLSLMALCFLLCGIGFKIGVVPFHMWVPDAYEGAVTPTTAFMAVVVKTAAVASLLRVLFTCFSDPSSTDTLSGWPSIVIVLVVLSIAYGNLAAVHQPKLKRLLAYSSIAHGGYLLLGVLAAARLGAATSGAVLYYLAVYSLSTLLAFGVLVLLTSRHQHTPDLRELRGVGRLHPVLALPAILGFLSLLGFPLTAGFFGKYYLLSAAVNAGGMLVGLAVFAVLGSAIGAYYYLKVLATMFMQPVSEHSLDTPLLRSGLVTSAVVICSVAVLWLGIAPSGVMRWAELAAASLGR